MRKNQLRNNIILLKFDNSFITDKKTITRIQNINYILLEEQLKWN